MPAAGSTSSIPITACRWMLEELDLDRQGELEAAVVAYPHGAAAPLVAELRQRGVRVVDLSADFRIRDLDTYQEWYQRAPRA